jgi:L-asparagine transporter-like permease
MSVVLPAVSSRVFRTMELWFTLCKMILICTAPGLCLGMGIYSNVIRGGRGWGRGGF